MGAFVTSAIGALELRELTACNPAGARRTGDFFSVRLVTWFASRVVDGEVLWETNQTRSKIAQPTESWPWDIAAHPWEVDWQNHFFRFPPPHRDPSRRSLIAGLVSPMTVSDPFGQTEESVPCYGFAALPGKTGGLGPDADRRSRRSESIGGCDAETGKRLWRCPPDVEGDFNVPTRSSTTDVSLINDAKTNGARLYYAFTEDGMIHPIRSRGNNRFAKPQRHRRRRG